MTAMIHAASRPTLWLALMLSFTLAAGCSGCSEKNTNDGEGNGPAKDCSGTAGGSASVDECGICDADPSNDCVQDCAGVWGGNYQTDSCGECTAISNPTAVDCNGDCNGTAERDCSDSCAGGETGTEPLVEDCEDVCGGTAVLDNCGICGGDGTSCEGESVCDACGVCDDDPTNDNTVMLDGSPAEQDCNGIICGGSLRDDCGICDEDSSNDNTTCVQDCAELWGGTATVDLCGICDTNPTNDNTECLDCFGNVGGTAVLDDCGVCDGSNTCFDCAGVAGGTAVTDECGVCVGGTTGLFSTCDNGCTGTGEYIDLCGNCVGGSTGESPCVEDCEGNPGGGAITDSCERCVQGFTGLTACAADCAGNWGGGAFTDECTGCVGGATGLPPCTQDCAGVYGGSSSTVTCDGQDVCVDLDSATWFCDPSCTGTMDCAGVCDGPSLLDNCGVCDDDTDNDCFRDCNEVFAGLAVKDDCGTCDEDSTNDCRAISFMPTPSLIEAVFADTRLYDFRYFEYNEDDFGDGQEAPDCDWDDNGNCWLLEMGISNISDPYNPEELTIQQLNGVPLEVTLSQNGYYLLFAGVSYGLVTAEVTLAEPYVTMDKEAGTGVGETPAVYVENKPTLPEGVYSISVAEQNDLVYTLYGNSVNPGTVQPDNPVSILHIVDISSYPTITEVGTYEFPSNLQAWDIEVHGSYAYVASGDAGISVIDVSDASSPQLVITAAPSTVDGVTHSFETVSVGSGFVVGTTGYGGEVFNISTPALPTSTGSFISTYPRDVVIETRTIDDEDATILFIADQAAGLSLFELDSESAPERRGALSLPLAVDDCLDPNGIACSTSAVAVDVRGSTAFVSTNLGLFGILLGF